MRTEIKSSLLKSYVYDKDKKILEVEFLKNGRVYRYSNVTPEEFDALLAAESFGSHFLKNIKPSHPCERIDEEKTQSGQA
jgi:hypothetical protein